MSKRIARAERRATRQAAATARARMTRRGLAASVLTGVALVVIGQKTWSNKPTLTELGVVTVFKSPSCQCCGKWIQRMREHGFAVAERNTNDMAAVKQERAIPAQLGSCHTSTVGGYAVEGHVPPDLVERVLRDRPAIAGLAVPGMPRSAPGMELGAERYDVLSFTQAGAAAVYAER
jgi:hypothetical protein